MTNRRDPHGLIAALIAAGLLMVGGGLLVRFGGDSQGAAQSDALSPADIDTTNDPHLRGPQQ